MGAPLTVTVTGAAGQIGYALLFRLAAGSLGTDRPIRVRMLEIPAAVEAAHGTAMELADAAFPLLESVDVFDNPAEAFEGANAAFMVGARPRTAGMERRDLLAANAQIFGPQGHAINNRAADDIRVLVVGNPANTNAMIASSHAPDIPADRFTAMTRLDHNRGLALLAEHLDVGVGRLGRLTIWGNHSSTQVPDPSHVRLDGQPVDLDLEWVRDVFVPTVANRGAAIIAARGASSAASAASAALDHMRDWMHGTGCEWTSVALPSRGEFGVPAGLVSSFPARSVDGQWQIVEEIHPTCDVRTALAASVAELEAERAAVRALGAMGKLAA